MIGNAIPPELYRKLVVVVSPTRIDVYLCQYPTYVPSVPLLQEKLPQIIDLLNFLYTDITSRRLIVEGTYVPEPIERMPAHSHSAGGGGGRHPSHGGGALLC